MKLLGSLVLIVASLTLAGCSATPVSSPAQSNTDAPTTSTTVNVDPCAGAQNWTEAASLMGSKAFIRGPVKSVLHETSSTGEPTFINIGADYPSPSRFTVVIWGKSRSQFATPPETAYDGATVCVRGRVQDYRGVAQMQVSSPSQIITGS